MNLSLSNLVLSVNVSRVCQFGLEPQVLPLDEGTFTLHQLAPANLPKLPAGVYLRTNGKETPFSAKHLYKPSCKSSVVLISLDLDFVHKVARHPAQYSMLSLQPWGHAILHSLLFQHPFLMHRFWSEAASTSYSCPSLHFNLTHSEVIHLSSPSPSSQLTLNPETSPRTNRTSCSPPRFPTSLSSSSPRLIPIQQTSSYDDWAEHPLPVV